MTLQNSIKVIAAFMAASLCSNSANAQLVNCNAFLKGNYVEVGININGAFGSSENSPVGYHPRGASNPSMQNTCTGGCSTGPQSLGFVADPAKDGWTIGTPNYIGDYFLPSFPQEGWSVEVNGIQGNAWNAAAICGAGAVLFTGGLTGNNLSYTGTGPTRTTTWQGNNGSGLTIKQVTVLDTSKVFFTMYVTLKNTTTSTMSNVYYLRTVDPDNEVAVPGITLDGYSTINHIDYQLPNALNATLVSAVGSNFGAYLGLGTLDCRARCFINNSGLEPTVNCDALFAGSSTATYSGGFTGDVCIGLLFNLGNIAPGDSVQFGYAYVLSSADLLDALHSTTSGWASSADTVSSHASHDTSYVCTNSVDTVTITNPGTYDWNWVSITGEPLSTYTGTTTHVTVGTTVVRLMAFGTGVCVTPDTVYMVINPSLGPGTVTAGSNSPLCAGGTLNLTSSATNSGTTFHWAGPASFSSALQNPTISGVTTGASGVYSVTASADGCISPAVTTTVVVTSGAGTITGVTTLCSGDTATLHNTVAGGTWSSGPTTIATIDSVTGFMSAMSAGTAIVTYSIGESCLVMTTITVTSGPPAITGNTSVCVGSLDTLHNTSTGGTWSSSVPGVATIGLTNGIARGVSPGITTITYTFGGCHVTMILTVVAAPAAITPATAVSICTGATTALGETSTGGSWTSNNTAIATVTSGGVVTGVSNGTVNITYGTPSCYVIKPVTVAGPAPILPHSPSICAGGTVTLTDATTGGVWSGGSTAIATVNSGGLVTGVAPGSTGIFYTFGGCTVGDTVTVVAGVAAISPSGPVNICTGNTITLSDPTAGGVWGSSAPGIATVTSGGAVTGVAAGVANISYTLGSCYVIKTVTVTTGPEAISPASASLCIGTTTTFTDATAGGVWGSSATGIATVSTGGAVTPLAVGSATISYTIGTCYALATVTVNNSPAAIAPSAAVSVCLGSTTNLADPTPGGVWSSGSTGIATVSATGTVRGVGLGVAIISYSIGSCSATKLVTVTAGPGPISPLTATVCVGSITTFTDPTSGGVWSSGNPFVATISSGGAASGATVGTAPISYSIGTCIVTASLTVVNPPAAIVVTGATTICSGSTTTVTDATAGGVWGTGTSTIATVSPSGTVTGLSTGIAIISYSVGSCAVTTTINITPGPSPLSPSSATICSGTPLTLIETVSGGVWSSTNATVATVSTGGVVTGLTAGTATISYAIGTCVTIATVTVNLSAGAGTITGASSECVGASAIVLTDAAPGGVWSSGSPAVATVSTLGVVTGLSVGTANISYSVSSSCGTAVATHMVTINATASAGAITGPSTVCAGTFTTLFDAVAGGVWSASNGNASITSTGLLTGITPGTDTITYTVTASCGTASATKIITVGPFLTAGVISGPSVVCQGAHITLTDPAPGGVWSSFNTAIATVSGTGIVTGAGVGIDTIFYTVSSSCGSARASRVVTVNPAAPSAGAITAPSGLCIGAGPVTLTETVTGGAWSASNSHASITGGGVVTAVSAGVDTIRYTVTSTCGISVATAVITVSATPSAGSISGPTTVCIGSFITLTDAAPGGIWGVSNTNAAISPTGTLIGVNAGTDVISYTVTNACGTAVATVNITIYPTGSAGTITGPDSVCIGSSITLTGSVPGGTWTSGNPHATVSTGGAVTGVSLGTTPITYSVTTVCGSAFSIKNVTVTSVTSVAPISGISIVCVGSGITLSDPTPGGTWVASNGHAIVVAPGIIHGVTVGVDTIYYQVAGACGTGSAFKVLSVDPVPVVTPIIGPTTICLGSTVTFTDATPGGVWTSSFPSIATIDLPGGVAMGLSLGIATLTYTVTNVFGCPTSVTIQDTVVSPMGVAPITGSAGVCIGSTVTLSDATAGGTWSSSNSAIANINSTTGAVTGVSGGTVTITYTVVNNCGTTYVTRTETVNPLPSVGIITGTAIQCVGNSTTLSSVTIGGVWSSNDTSIATVNPSSGVVTGVSPGSVTIYYTYTNSFGCSYTVSITDMVYPAPFVAPITGILRECPGGTTALADATPGGVWSSGSPAIATIDVSGMVTGVASGTTVISYSVTAGCTASVTAIDTVDVLPAVTPITGPATTCVGMTITLHNSLPGGVWSSSNTALATVDAATGVVTGVGPGTDKIYYTVSNGCGSTVDSVFIVINPAAYPGVISAPYTDICGNTSVHLTDSVPTGGVWSSSNNIVATVDSVGTVYGIAIGYDTIYYTVTNGLGCTASASIIIHVTNIMPHVEFAPSGTATLCRGHFVPMHVVATGGSVGLTYQWKQDGDIIPGATNSSYTTYTSGEFSVVVSSGDCSVTLTGTTVIMAPPNPVISFTPPNILYTSLFVSYQWYLDWVPIPGATSSMLHAKDNGVYHVVVKDINGCMDTSGQYSAVLVTGVDGITGPDEIKIFPNPSNSIVNIESPVSVNVSLLSVDGKVLIEQKNATSINVSPLPDGLYMIMVYDGENKLLIKTVKFAKIE